MNKLFGLLILAFAFSMTGFAQEYETEAQLIEGVIGQAKKDFIVEIVDIPEKNSEKFWELYNSYEDSRRDFARTRVNMVNTYLANMGLAKDGQEERFINQVFTQRHNYEKLIKKYYKKMAKSVSHKTAMQFFQAEEYINSKVDARMFEVLPLNRHVGE